MDLITPESTSVRRAGRGAHMLRSREPGACPDPPGLHLRTPGSLKDRETWKQFKCPSEMLSKQCGLSQGGLLLALKGEEIQTDRRPCMNLEDTMLSERSQSPKLKTAA